jgi:hypothetical protein
MRDPFHPLVPHAYKKVELVSPSSTVINGVRIAMGVTPSSTRGACPENFRGHPVTGDLLILS